VGIPQAPLGLSAYRLSRLGFDEVISQAVFEVVREGRAMSSSTESGSWLDSWWPLLVILFGLISVSILVTFSPKL
jgi:hypothetical protein